MIGHNFPFMLNRLILPMFRKIVLLLLLMKGMNLYASHIIGGDIYYDFLGNNKYKFYVTLYRDCNSTGADYDDPMSLTIYRANGTLLVNLAVPFPGSELVPIPFNNPCATPPKNLCVERAVYTAIVTLPPFPGGYDISYQRCCRGPNIINLIAPDDTGLTLTTHIPGSETGLTENSSPRFTDYPPMLLCNNEQKNIDHSATDPDGDKLVYSLVAPFSGATSSVPMPSRAPAPPYDPVQWTTGFGSAFPLGPNPSITINAENGIITVNPKIIGLFVVGVRAQEFRNGKLVGETVRDFLFRVFDCKIVLQAILPLQEELKSFESYCQGLTVEFENQSYGGKNYIWDFGVPGTTTDESTVFAPTFSYPKPGSYQARLIVNPGMPCTDTTYMDIKVNVPFSLSWTSEDSLCISGNSFNFIGKSSNSSAKYSWEFGSNASIQTSSNLTVSNVSYNRSGFHLVKLKAEDGDCKSSYSDSIFIFDVPTSKIEIPPSIRCSGLTVPFGNNSLNASNYRWDFGVSNTKTDVSNEFEPTYTFPISGKYTIRLISGSSSNCKDTSSIEITLNNPINLSFNHNDSLCITDGLYDFDGTAIGQPTATFLWDFGSNSEPQNATTLDVTDVKFSKSGVQAVKLFAFYDVCKDSVVTSVFVFSEPSIDFEFVDSLQCAPSNAEFINKSQSNSPTTYFWDFGDGGFSNSYNPSYVYNEAGSYSVSLTMITSKGCVDTLYLMKQDLVQVFSQPKAGFNVYPNKVDLCEPDVEFIDKSVGATSYFYYFDDRKFTSTEANFFHKYTQSGGDYPIQVVTNGNGCSDTAIRSIFVEPFAIYIPNTFIPDGNKSNDIFIPKTHYEFEGWLFQIYNKWGELLFETNQHNQGWDGTYQLNPCQDGTYIYSLKFNPCDTPYATEQITGFVNLIR